MAPLYCDGRIYVGLSGGEYGVRSRVNALDAATGELWRFYTIPGPGRRGHGTWPSTNDAWKHGGRVVWNTPAVDPALGYVDVSTSNAAELFNGHDRPRRDPTDRGVLGDAARRGDLDRHLGDGRPDPATDDMTRTSSRRGPCTCPM